MLHRFFGRIYTAGTNFTRPPDKSQLWEYEVPRMTCSLNSTIIVLPIKKIVPVIICIMHLPIDWTLIALLHVAPLPSTPVVQMAYLPLKANLFCLNSDQKKKNRFEILD